MNHKTLIVLLTLALGVVTLTSVYCDDLGVPLAIWGEPYDYDAGPGWTSNLFLEDSQLHLQYASVACTAQGAALTTRRVGAVWGFAYTTTCVAGLWHSHIAVPIWLVVLVLLTYPALAFLRGPLRRYRRRKRGLCVRCGYNLTGLTEPRCPECGGAVGQV
jgi:hypothetical protein